MAHNGVCPFVMTRKLVLHTLLTLLLVLVQATQGIILDTFLISASPNSLYPYFWLISDLFILFCFGITMVKSYSYWKKRNGASIRVRTKTQIAESRRRPSLFVKYKSYLGFHPLTYMAWFFYSIILVVKISLIFKSEILNKELDPNTLLNSQLMKLCICLTALVFFLFVEGHSDVIRNSQRALYITSLVKNTAFEVFDSVAFLSLLIISETKQLFSFEFENVIIVFACINLLLPNICFYKLSQNDYGRVTTSVFLSFAYKLLHLLLVNIPYMFVRIYLWIMLDVELSIFLIKNILHIFLALLDCKTEMKIIVPLVKKYFGCKDTPRKPCANDSHMDDSHPDDSLPYTDTELTTVKMSKQEDNFVEIDLGCNSDNQQNNKPSAV